MDWHWQGVFEPTAFTHGLLERRIALGSARVFAWDPLFPCHISRSRSVVCVLQHVGRATACLSNREKLRQNGRENCGFRPKFTADWHLKCVESSERSSRHRVMARWSTDLGVIMFYGLVRPPPKCFGMFFAGSDKNSMSSP